jgi:hypothetical protein
MTKDQCIALVQRRLGYRTDLAVDIITEMDLAQLDLTYGLPTPWFLRSTFIGILEPPAPPEVNRGIFTLPPGFISFVYPDFSIVYYEEPQFSLRAMPYPQMRDDLLPMNRPLGRPERYAQRNASEIQLWPSADRTYYAEFYCYMGDELIENLQPGNAEGSTNKWTYTEPELLAVATALRIAPTLRDAELTAYLTNEVTRLTERLNRMTYEKQEQGIDRIINESLFTDMAPEVR